MIQFSSVTQSYPTLCNPMSRSTPGLPVDHQLREFTQTHVHRVESVMPSSHLILCRPLLLLPLIPPSMRVFSNESTLHMRWPKYWSFSFSIIPSEEYPGRISFRMDLLALLGCRNYEDAIWSVNSSSSQFGVLSGSGNPPSFSLAWLYLVRLLPTPQQLRTGAHVTDLGCPRLVISLLSRLVSNIYNWATWQKKASSFPGLGLVVGKLGSTTLRCFLSIPFPPAQVCAGHS